MRPAEPPAPRRWTIETTVKNMRCESSSPFAPGALYFSTECRTEIPEHQRICEEQVCHLLAGGHPLIPKNAIGWPVHPCATIPYLSRVRRKNAAGETWNRLLNFPMWVLLSSRFLSRASDTMLSDPKMGTRSFWRRLLASISVRRTSTGGAPRMG